jgi:EpsI family protein
MSTPVRAVARSDLQSANGAVVAVLALIALVGACQFSDATGLWDQWRGSYTYSHGILILLMLPWLVWRQRDGLAFEGRTPLLASGLALFCVELLSMFAHGAHVDVVTYALLPVLAWLGVLILLGPSSAHRLAFPFAWFWCAVSLWDVLGPVLQRATAVMDSYGLAVLGIPALRVGNTITVPAGTFEVAAACSGLNFFVVAITIATLLGHLERWKLGRRLAVIGAAALVAVVSNWLRVCIIIAAGQWSDMHSSLVTEGHYGFGWWLFAISLSIFLWAVRRTNRSAEVPDSRYFGPVAQWSAILPRAALVVLLVGAVAAIAAFRGVPGDSLPRATVRLPAARGVWSGPRPTETAWRPEFAGASSRDVGAYDGPAGSVVVDLTFYARQGRGAKLIGYPSNPDGPPGSTVLERRMRMLAAGSGTVGAVREMVVETGRRQRWRVWQWFQAGPTTTASEIRMKLHEGWQAIVGGGGSAAVSLAVACADECRGDQETATLSGFAADMQDLLVGAAAGGARP